MTQTAWVIFAAESQIIQSRKPNMRDEQPPRSYELRQPALIVRIAFFLTKAELRT